MSIELYPWEHLITDTYYKTDLFLNMKKELDNFVNGIKINNKHLVLTQLDEEYNTLFVSYENKIIKSFPNTKKCLESIQINKDDLKKFSKCRRYENLILKTNINICLNDVEYPIHDDVVYKILTNVIYVSPDVAMGTMLYDENKNFVKEIKWKPNRSLIFPPIDNITWHNYKSTNDYRITINQFLVK